MVISIKEDGSDYKIYAFWCYEGRDALRQFIENCAEMENEDVFPLKIEMPCGEKYEFLMWEEIPTNSLPCRCGNENHYIFKYFYH